MPLSDADLILPKGQDDHAYTTMSREFFAIYRLKSNTHVKGYLTHEMVVRYLTRKVHVSSIYSLLSSARFSASHIASDHELD